MLILEDSFSFSNFIGGRKLRRGQQIPSVTSTSLNLNTTSLLNVFILSIYLSSSCLLSDSHSLLLYEFVTSKVKTCQ